MAEPKNISDAIGELFDDPQFKRELLGRMAVRAMSKELDTFDKSRLRQLRAQGTTLIVRAAPGLAAEIDTNADAIARRINEITGIPLVDQIIVKT